MTTTWQTSPGIAQVLAGGAAASFNTDVVDRGAIKRAGLLQIDATAGSTPTVTANIQGSLDGVNWFNVPYATTAAPGAAVVAALTLTTTAVTQYHLLDFAWRFLRVAFTANTNVTINAVTALI